MVYQRNRKAKKPSPSKKRWIIIAILVLAALAAAFLIWKYLDNKPKKNEDTTKQTTTLDSGAVVDMSPPTEEEKKTTEDHKDQLADQKKQEESPPPSNASGTAPVINYATQSGNTIEVAAFVPGVVEDGGTCTLTATLGANTVTRQTTGVRNAQNTVCPTFEIPRSAFASAGNWTVIVKYASAAHSGSSQSQTLKVEL